MKLSRKFYSRDAREVSIDLLGKILVHDINGIKLKGRIVETEAYIADLDKASHAYGGRRTARNEALYGKPGISYVFSIYGLYYCFNVITKKEESAEGVLVRALEPVDGLDEIARLRFKTSYDKLTRLQVKNLTSGPSKLCMALNITKENNMEDLCGDKLYIEYDKNEDPNNKFEIVHTKRIGIDYAEEAKDFLWRYYIKDNPYVSKK
ncbi:DNA-3-methyladenine glycosylase [Clostridium sp. JN-9]|uniref:DNA-3-methyladenine glycosylase n=1 Tax=Clostridium sp. JN-9 TaxID=2507159 RepID=UPI000FFE2694|nr:DNA-3-methyladenine glycosylase [Clostridium sp. JN-9]QAT41192.1 DNA-3-methyladenine glycosylase [Clostridium sp. JN-9]